MKLILFALTILSCLCSIVDAQSNPHYMTTDPAIQEMLMAIDMPRSTGSSSFASMTADPAIREMLISMNMPRYAGNVPVETIAGNWQLSFSDGDRIELALQQSGAAIFGRDNHEQHSFPGCFCVDCHRAAESGGSPESATELLCTTDNSSS